MRGIVRAFKRAFKGIPKEYFKTITVDNGKEFAGFKEVERELAVDVYFCSPYSPWEKGSNENFNGILRQFYPKKTDFKEVSKISLMRTVELIRERPRKILDYFTANEIFWDRVKWCAWHDTPPIIKNIIKDVGSKHLAKKREIETKEGKHTTYRRNFYDYIN